MRVAIIVLAAGSSSRLGRSKQLIEIDGEALLVRSVKSALASGADPVVVVLGADEQAHRKAIQHLSAQIIYNAAWTNGMGSSLKVGLNHLLLNTPDLEAVVIMVCDQPLLHADHLQKLIARHNERRSIVVASQYADTLGVPVLFDKALFQKLLQLDDEHGAKKIIQQFNEDVDAIDFPEGSIDLDTPKDYEKFFRNNSQQKKPSR